MAGLASSRKSISTGALQFLFVDVGDEDVDLAALRTLAAIARLGSISAAAQELGVTQQAASARLRSFERRSGIELLIRRPSGAELTSRGKLVLAWSEELLSASQRFSAGLRGLAADRGGQLNVAASQTVAGHLLPEWIVRLRQEEEALGTGVTSMHLRTANSTEVVRSVEEGSCDLGFIETPEVPTTLGSTVVGQDELVLVVAPSHRWASRTDVSLESVASTPLVAREEGSGTRSAWEHLVRERLDVSPAAPHLALASNAAVRSSVRAGAAPGVVSLLAVSDDIALGRLIRVPIAGQRLLRDLTALWRGGARDLGDPARHLLAAATDERRHSLGFPTE